MEKDTRGGAPPPPLVADAPGKHLYVKTAYVLAAAAPAGGADAVANALLQALTPAAHVLAAVADLEARAGPLARRIGVHMRTRTVAADGVAVDPACEYTAASVAVANSWRARSSPARFAPAMRAQLAARFPTRAHRAAADAAAAAGAPPPPDWAPGFLVAADDAAAVDEAARLCGRGCAVATMEHGCRGRDAACVAGAFADAVALSRCGALLLSGWSSFSEAAWRLRPADADEARALALHGEHLFPLLLSGADFGTDRWTDRLAAVVDPRRWPSVVAWADTARRRKCGDAAAAAPPAR
jgi:hypothetical protein